MAAIHLLRVLVLICCTMTYVMSQDELPCFMKVATQVFMCMGGCGLKQSDSYTCFLECYSEGINNLFRCTPIGGGPPPKYD
ncbi:hypothetical protein ACHQM5_025997 [Ranunculus cassubicifolius]